MTQREDGPVNVAWQLPPKWWGIAGLALGLLVGSIIMWKGDPHAALGTTIGSAVTAFLGFVVAGWGITQAEIAHEARDAAKAQAAAASAQVAEARLARLQAEQAAASAAAEAAQQRDHADRTLRATIKQRLDAQAPRVTINAQQASSAAPLYLWRHAPRAAEKEGAEWSTRIPDRPFDMDAGEAQNVQVRLSIGIRVLLHGEIPARIDCIDAHLAGLPNSVILTPQKPEALLTWISTIGASGDYFQAKEKGQETNGQVWRPRFWVRDISMNTIDEMVFSGTISVMRREGKYMMLTPGGVNLGEPYAGQLPRKYEYFDRPEGQEELGILR